MGSEGIRITQNMDARWARNGLRWWIARLADRLWPNACWVQLALWAAYPEHHRFLEILDLRESAVRGGITCEQEAEQLGTCYCGKIRRTSDDGIEQ